MDYNQIFALSDKDLRGAFNAQSKNPEFDDYRLFRGEINIESTFYFDCNYGQKIYDLVNTGFPGLYLFSEKIMENISLCFN